VCLWISPVFYDDPSIRRSSRFGVTTTQFKFFAFDCPALADILTSYADDLSILESDSDLEELNRKLQEIFAPIIDWASRKKLTIAPSKSQVTLFSPWNKQLWPKFNPSTQMTSMRPSQTLT
jgi:hypothetical protein